MDSKKPVQKKNSITIKVNPAALPLGKPHDTYAFRDSWSKEPRYGGVTMDHLDKLEEYARQSGIR